MTLQVNGSPRLRWVPVRLLTDHHLLLLAAVCGSSLLIVSLTNRNDLVITEQPAADLETELEESFTIKTKGCTIPALKAFDEMIKPFIQTPTTLKQCPNTNYTLLHHNRTHIWINTEALEHYNLPSDARTSCCYIPFEGHSLNNTVKYDKCQTFYEYIQVAHEFVKVSCDYKKRTVYVQYFLFAILKNARINPPRNDKPYYNVIIMGLDSISRLNFQRTMPKTVTYLKKKHAIELLGYNKVGANTFPNVVSLLLGLNIQQFKMSYAGGRGQYFDNCPFIWKRYKDAGFYTAMGEDVASTAIFNFYYGKGFIKSPTDYYTHTFIKEAEHYVGNIRDFNYFLCMGNKYFYEVLLDYIKQLSITLASSKLFGFFWESTLSHDYLTYPMAMDDSYESFLQSLDQHNYLDKTVLIILSDHGIRYGGIRLTKQGRLEESLPFLHILLPTSFHKNYKLAYNNLKNNAKRLTTPFDIYATLSDLINLDSISNHNIKQRSEPWYSDNRSISLFLPIPGNRTCKTADINDQWCTCSKTKKISSKNFEGRSVAVRLVKLLNEFLEAFRQCAQLKLVKVLEVSEIITVGEPRRANISWREFIAVVQTTPGDGLFEGTLRKQNDKWSLVGTISRLNLYGNQSHCVNDYQYKLYCYCSY